MLKIKLKQNFKKKKQKGKTTKRLDLQLALESKTQDD